MSDGELEYIILKVTTFIKNMTPSKDLCKMLKDDLDKTYGPAWHVIVGKNFGCYAVHDKNKFVNYNEKENCLIVGQRKGIISFVDLLRLNDKCRINVPSLVSEKNWSYKLVNFDKLYKAMEKLHD